jgi:hypothetical protein
MTEKIVELIRRFTPMSSRAKEWAFLTPGLGRPQRWHEIEDEQKALKTVEKQATNCFQSPRATHWNCRFRTRHRAENCPTSKWVEGFAKRHPTVFNAFH